MSKCLPYWPPRRRRFRVVVLKRPPHRPAPRAGVKPSCAATKAALALPPTRRLTVSLAPGASATFAASKALPRKTRACQMARTSFHQSRIVDLLPRGDVGDVDHARAGMADPIAVAGLEFKPADRSENIAVKWVGIERQVALDLEVVGNRDRGRLGARARQSGRHPDCADHTCDRRRKSCSRRRRRCTPARRHRMTAPDRRQNCR
jgi:hypothetical protein